jgi:hypothetical protein
MFLEIAGQAHNDVFIYTFFEILSQADEDVFIL